MNNTDSDPDRDVGQLKLSLFMMSIEVNIVGNIFKIGPGIFKILGKHQNVVN